MTCAYSVFVCLVSQSCPTLCDPMDCRPPGSSVPGDFPGKNTGVGCHGLLQGFFPTQGSNPGLPHCRRVLYQLNHKEMGPIQINHYSRMCTQRPTEATGPTPLTVIFRASHLFSHHEKMSKVFLSHGSSTSAPLVLIQIQRVPFLSLGRRKRIPFPFVLECS